MVNQSPQSPARKATDHTLTAVQSFSTRAKKMRGILLDKDCRVYQIPRVEAEVKRGRNQRARGKRRNE
jgi:hypothetical protein